MNIYALTYLSIIGCGIIVSIAFILSKSIKQSKIQKEQFSEDALLSYKEMVVRFKVRYNISDKDSVMDIVQKIGLRIDRCPRSKMEGYDGKIRDCIITIADDLSMRQKNATIAHEIAHYMRSNSRPCKGECKTKTIQVRAKEEQYRSIRARRVLQPSVQLFASSIAT